MLQKSYVGSSLSIFFFETTLWRWIPFLYFEWWSECHFMNSREEFLITVCRHSWTFFYLHFLSCIWNPCLFLNGFILILLHRQLVGYQKLLWQHLRTWNTAGKVLHFPLYFCYSIVYWIVHIVFEPSCGLVVQLLICTVYPIPLGLTLCWWSISTLEIYSDQLIITIWFQVLILRSAYYDFMILIICLMISKMDYATGSLHH